MVELSTTLQQTFDAIANTKSPPTILDVYCMLPDRDTIVITAVHRRIERLVKMNLIRKVAKSSPARYEVV